MSTCAQTEAVLSERLFWSEAQEPDLHTCAEYLAGTTRRPLPSLVSNHLTWHTATGTAVPFLSVTSSGKHRQERKKEGQLTAQLL